MNKKKINMVASVLRLPKILNKVDKGQIMSPNFQRNFAWSKNDMLELLKSIYYGYPIGSFLFSSYLNLENEYLNSRPISPFIEHYNKPNHNPTNYYPSTDYVLDGYQRLVTLYGVLKLNEKHFSNNNQKDDRWFIYFNLEKLTFEHLKNKSDVKPEHFPMWKILNTSSYIEEFKRINENLKFNKASIQKYEARAEELISNFLDYEIPIITISGGTIDDTTNVFRVINARGKKLNTEELYSSIIYKYHNQYMNLGEDVIRIKNEIKLLGFNSIPNRLIFTTIFNSFNIYSNSSFEEKKNYIFENEYSSQIIRKSENSLIKTIHFLKNTMGIFDYNFIPHKYQFIFLTELFKDESVYNLTKKNLTDWFWHTSFVDYETYEKSQYKLILNLKTIKNSNSVANLNSLFDFSKQATPLDDEFDFNQPRIKAFVLFLSSLNPISLNNNQPFDLQEAFSLYNNQLFTPIFKDTRNKNLTSNIILLDNLNNSNSIHNLYQKLYSQNSNIQDEYFLKSHAIPSSNQFSEHNVTNKKYINSFLNERRKLLIELEYNFIKKHGVTLG